MNNKLTYIEQYAVGLTLSDWPREMSLLEIFEGIENDHEDIAIWEPFENMGADWVIETIGDYIDSLEAFIEHLPSELIKVKE